MTAQTASTTRRAALRAAAPRMTWHARDVSERESRTADRRATMGTMTTPPLAWPAGEAS
ncbi:hypothetical protein Psi02_42050 [Planotetraspora silvatica]|uniref:Uncharacterized protein n=1 Tax=Planotetraspora silvatica TaxID=234614 RepID=A0A8J3XPV8_9ACTN|nr:hypothetical protein Psi02_42050 [Planotetraspora silvatica]